jgi:hypothetical protein
MENVAAHYDVQAHRNFVFLNDLDSLATDHSFTISMVYFGRRCYEQKNYERMSLKSALHTSLTRKYLYATIMPVL